MSKTPKKVFISWDRYQAYGRALARRVVQQGWTDHRLCAIARGGLPLAAIMAHYLGETHVDTIQCTSYAGQARGAVSFRGYAPYNETYPERELPTKVLLVDDLVDSGNTVAACADAIYTALQVRGVKTPLIRYAAILRGKKAVPAVGGVYVDHKIDDTWIVFPYEPREFEG